jgi:hypothetical protein
VRVDANLGQSAGEMSGGGVNVGARVGVDVW